MTEFKKGDLVRHVLGQRMQVKTVHSTKLVECFWFDAHGTPHTEGFLTVDLTPEPDESATIAPVARDAADDFVDAGGTIVPDYGPRIADDHDQF